MPAFAFYQLGGFIQRRHYTLMLGALPLCTRNGWIAQDIATPRPIGFVALTPGRGTSALGGCAFQNTIDSSVAASSFLS